MVSTGNSKQHCLLTVTQLRSGFNPSSSFPHHSQLTNSQRPSTLLPKCPWFRSSSPFLTAAQCSPDHDFPPSQTPHSPPLSPSPTSAAPMQNPAKFPGLPNVDCCLPSSSSVPAHGGHSASHGWMEGRNTFNPWLHICSDHNRPTVYLSNLFFLRFPSHNLLISPHSQVPLCRLILPPFC